VRGLELTNIVSGKIYAEGGFIDGYVRFENGVITEVSEGKHRGKSLAEGIILPYLSSCHTHIGDACLRGKIDRSASLEELVKPPGGLKHTLLAKQSDAEMIESMGAAIDEMRYFGVGRFIDFREGGLKGLMLLKQAISDHNYPVPIILSRPEGLTYSEQEVDSLLDGSDGIGISAVRDWPFDQLSLLASHVRDRGKVLAMHASEAVREDISKVLGLDPDLLVHMSSASAKDLEACKDADVPVVVCPRSNAGFGIKLDIAKMIDAGLDVCLGTDNAMLNNLSIIDEMRAAYSSKSNSRPLELLEVFKLAIDNPRKVLNDKAIITVGAGSPCEFMVVRAGVSDSPEELLRPKTDYMIELVSRGSRIWKSEPWRKSKRS
jgi:cytosine/adenosine deaminase-related metal-dependent hydrolase